MHLSCFVVAMLCLICFMTFHFINGNIYIIALLHYYNIYILLRYACIYIVVNLFEKGKVLYAMHILQQVVCLCTYVSHVFVCMHDNTCICM